MFRAIFATTFLAATAATAAPITAGEYDGLVLAVRAEIGLVNGVLTAAKGAQCAFSGRVQHDGAARVRMSDSAGEFVGRLEHYKGGFRLLHDRSGASCPPMKGKLKKTAPWTDVQLVGPKGARVTAPHDPETIRAKLKAGDIVVSTARKRWSLAHPKLARGVLTGDLISPPSLKPEPGTLTVTDVTKALGPDQANGARLDAWSTDGKAFGTCAWMCNAREDSPTRQCSVSLVDRTRYAPLEPVRLQDWVSYNFKASTGPAQAEWPIADGYSVWAVGGLDDDVGNWSLRSRHEQQSIPMVVRSGEALERPEPMISRSPKGDALAVYVEFSGDHGCGDRDGATVALPEGPAEAWIAAGLKLHVKGHWALAIKRYKAALTIDPASRKAKYNIACARALLGEVGPAAALMAGLIKLDKAHYQRRLREDADFTKIRGHALIQALLKK